MACFTPYIWEKPEKKKEKECRGRSPDSDPGPVAGAGLKADWRRKPETTADGRPAGRSGEHEEAQLPITGLSSIDVNVRNGGRAGGRSGRPADRPTEQTVLRLDFF